MGGEGRQVTESPHKSPASKTRTLVEIARFPPPMGSWSLRIDFLAQDWTARGHKCLLMNIDGSRKSKDSRYLNVRGPLDFIVKVARAAAQGHLLHTHTNAKGIKGTLLALCAQLISLCFGRRSVLTFHAGVKQQYFPRTGKRWLDFLMRLTFVTPRYVICNSEKVKKRIVEDYGISEAKVFPIPAFCSAYMQAELVNFSARVREFVDAHHPLLVSYVFFFHPEFRVDLMVQAVKRLREEYPDLGLIVMGSLQYVEDYLPMIDEMGLEDHVLLTGNLPREEFLSVLKRGELYLRTPVGDGVAASVLESLAIGTPVVASDNGSRPASCVLYREGHLGDMVDKIRYVLENRKQVLAQIVPPDSNDTIKKEVELLLSVFARGRMQGGTGKGRTNETTFHAKEST